ncbi:MAG: alkaline phosphatase [Myxococcota bacterium]
MSEAGSVDRCAGRDPWRGASRPLRAALAVCLVGALAACAGPGVPAEDPALPAPLDDPWFSAGRAEARAVAATRDTGPRARNVILFVGDGMGISTITAARILEGQRQGRPGEGSALSFEALPEVALVRTYNTNQQVPDSAGTMTAMMSGVKTKAGILGLSDGALPGDHTTAAHSRVPTLLERAEVRGLATGVVSTARITHATPAACYAHSPLRNWEDDTRLSAAARADGFVDLARQLVEFEYGDGLEVALGGGRRHFLPAETPDPEYPRRRGARGDGLDLMQAWRDARPGSEAVWNAEQLAAVDEQSVQHLLGLFEPSHMQWEADRARDAAGEPSLSAMTVTALDVLSRNPRGFFLMVEAGRIDHAHHAGNAYRALDDTIELSNAVRAALDRVDLEETLVVVTADHSHVFTVTGYPTRGNDILGLVRPNGADGRPTGSPARDARGRPYTTLGYANGPGFASSQLDLSEVDTADHDFRQPATLPLRSETHGGEDVAVYAGGAGSRYFAGVREQSYVYHAIEAALGWSPR